MTDNTLQEREAFDYVNAILDFAATADDGAAINVHDAVKAIHQCRAQPAPAGDVVERLRGLLGLVPDSYKELAHNYAPGLAKCIEEIAALPTPSIGEWQPIETANYNNTPILLWWSKEQYMFVGFFCRETNSWLECGSSVDELHPTHWMPLPNPPEQPHD